MDLSDLVRALTSHDVLTARQWVADASREAIVWATVPVPADLDATSMAIAAGVAELLASRARQDAPAWTSYVPAVLHPVFLLRAATTMPRLRSLCELEGPEPLRRRGILAPPDFLTIA